MKFVGCCVLILEERWGKEKKKTVTATLKKNPQCQSVNLFAESERTQSFFYGFDSLVYCPLLLFFIFLFLPSLLVGSHPVSLNS